MKALIAKMKASRAMVDASAMWPTIDARILPTSPRKNKFRDYGEYVPTVS